MTQPRSAPISSLVDARRWVWTRLLRRAGQATPAHLDYLWDWDPSLLSDALRSLRDDGMIGFAGGRWYMREHVQPNLLPLAKTTLPDPS
jgi:hypothetical protein